MKKLFLIFLILTCSCKANWSYDGRGKPDNWSKLDGANKFCKIGYNQSPINIVEKFEASELKFDYSVSDVEKEKKNYIMNVNFDGKNFVSRGKKKYLLRSLAFHHPSEHLVKGEPYSLEMQIAHKSDDEQWLMLGIFFEVGKENPNFKTLINFLNSKKTEAKIDPARIVKFADEVFFYDGSFTTPPCKEGVKWYVMKTPIQISKEQMNQIIKSAIFAKTNSRPVQKFHPEKY